ncbi:unnamed protein product [Mycena citricolor]|uniref:Uncharacterized protein n=1 Tax=Mycena citricolor TaxID=2018698 RepID=A0AAD2HSJ2_9AGAR|nr:unnamed protein product [Mycena citricolor]
MSAAKYSNLPDIDTAQDVYETEDTVPSATNKADAGSDDEAGNTRSTIRGTRSAEAAASKDELDMSNLMQHDEASKKFRKAERRREPRTYYAYPPSPTESTGPSDTTKPRSVPLPERLRALQAELSALETELADPTNPLLTKDQEAETVDAGELIRGLVDVRGRLDKIRKNKEGRGKLVGVILNGEEETKGDSGGDKNTSAVTVANEEPGKPNVRSIVEMDRRVGDLEKLIGTSTAALDETTPLPPPLLPLITRINSQLTLLTQPRHIDAISRRLKLLLSDLDRASASQHAHRRHPSQSNGAPPAPQIQEQILPLLARLGPSLPHIPHILTRLRTLSALHTSASQFQSTLDGLEEDQRKMRETLGELDNALKTIEKSLEDNRGVVQGNVTGLEGRVDKLLQRVDELSHPSS